MPACRGNKRGKCLCQTFDVWGGILRNTYNEISIKKKEGKGFFHFWTAYF